MRVEPRSLLPCFSKGEESKFHAFCSLNEQVHILPVRSVLRQKIKKLLVD